ncbi:hypothetical protein BD324DRAFT_14152 [Kockovaella imperatae]|uniref:mRNA export factor MEX67 n=1 Tax=Kockovaella imperatae TaxID=4999 RepID=A0A1Y1UT08_9TREE|nr:hypothetical protein BD324DRAFT_14152 [Kockovaella imperatae]ORX40664.1 hypothetical protein BD324DRAFT_14152 [Kockovaella imperatae]
MSAFQQALANAQPQASGSGSGSSLSIRGSAGEGPSARTLGTALRQAGISTQAGMEVDGGRGSRGKRASVHGRGPLDQKRRRIGGGDRWETDLSGASRVVDLHLNYPWLSFQTAPLCSTGRHRPPKNPYDKPAPPSAHSGPGRPVRARGSTSLPSAPHKTNLNNLHPRRQPEGTPPILKKRQTNEDRQAQATSHAKLNEKLGSQEMKDWLGARMISEGVMNMANLGEDAWLKENGILPPGARNAPGNAGAVFWRLIDHVIQRARNIPIHTLSLANNDFHSLRQLDKLPNALPHLRALDLSNNPIAKFTELEVLLASGEKKGKATAGAGGLKSLIELKLNGCTFREEALARPKGDDTYKHEILRRFPGLLILDGVNLDRIVFPIYRKPQVRRSEQEKEDLRKKPFSFPMDAQGGFIDNEIVKTFVMQFCAKYFPTFDNDRASILPAYAPNATASVSSNTLISRSWLQQNDVMATRSQRPKAVGFDAWTSLPGRNFLRTATSIDQRMKTLKSPMDSQEFLRFFSTAVPKTKHPLDDSTKWCIDAWVLGGEGVDTRLCAMIQGEFQEMPSATVRSFSRTFILADAPQGSPAHSNGWPATILSDTMVVHSYMSTGQYDDKRSLAKHGVTIVAPNLSNRDQLVTQMRTRTGMNAEYAQMCLNENGWDFEKAVANFEVLKATIPPEAFQ